MIFCSRTAIFIGKTAGEGNRTLVLYTTGEPLRFYTAEDWLRDWLKGKEVAKSEGTFHKYKYTIESFLTSLGERAKRNLNQITPRDIQRFRYAELEAGKHPHTCNFAVKHLRMPFNVARRQGLITHNPAEAVEMLATKGESTKRPFDLEQVAALLKTAGGDWRGAITVAFYTGARLQDVANMRWGSVDFGTAIDLVQSRQNRSTDHDSNARSVAQFSDGMPTPDSVRRFCSHPLQASERAGSPAFDGVQAHHGEGALQR